MFNKKLFSILTCMALMLLLPSSSFAFDNTYLSGEVVSGLSEDGGYRTTNQWDIDSDGINDLQTFCYVGYTYMKSINNATSYEEFTTSTNTANTFSDITYYASDINASRLSSGGSAGQIRGAVLAMRLSSGKYAHVHGWASGNNRDYCHFRSAIQNDGTSRFSSVRIKKEVEVSLSGITDAVIGSYIYLLDDSNTIYEYYKNNATLKNSTVLAGTSNRRLELNTDNTLIFTSDNRTIKSYHAGNMSQLDEIVLKIVSDPYYNETEYGWYVTDIVSRAFFGHEYLWVTITTNTSHGNRGRIIVIGVVDSTQLFNPVPLMWVTPNANTLGFNKIDTIVKDIQIGDFNVDGNPEMAYGVQGWDDSTYDYFVVQELSGMWTISSTIRAERVPSVDFPHSWCSDTQGRTGTAIMNIPATANYLWNNGEGLWEWQYYSQPCYDVGITAGGGLHEIIYGSSLSSEIELERDDLQFSSFLIDTDGDDLFDTLMSVGAHYSVLYEMDECGYKSRGACYPASYDNVMGVIVNDNLNDFGLSTDYLFQARFSNELLSSHTPIDLEKSQYGIIGGIQKGIISIGGGGFAIYSMVGEQSAPTISFTSNDDNLLIRHNYTKTFTVSDVDNDEDMNTVSGTIYYPDSSTSSAEYMMDAQTVYMVLDTNNTLTQSGSYYIVWQVSDGIGNTGYGTYRFTVTDTSCATLGQEGSWDCTSWSQCKIVGGVSIKWRTCNEIYDCGYSSPATEMPCEEEDLPDEPEYLTCYPEIIIPSTNSYNPSINSQTPTGFACFTNWYGYDDSYIDYMTYSINGETTTVYPNESSELCGKSESCVKHRGFVQTWDYADNYFTEYDKVNMTLEVTCYCYDKAKTSTTAYSREVNILPEYENFCYGEDEAVYKECFSYDDDLGGYITSAKDLNLLPNAYLDLGRVISEYHTPDKQMYRLTTDTINYFSDEDHENEAKDSYYKISRNQGYQIFELFSDPLNDGSVYVELFITDIYPKWMTLTNSDGKIQILLLFYDNNVYYFNGYSFKILGEYLLNTPLKAELIFDSDYKRFKMQVKHYFMHMDYNNNVYDWKLVGSWKTEKQGTYVSTTGGGDPIKYLGVTMTSELCNTDADCSSVLGNPQYYADVGSTAYPYWSDGTGFKLTDNFKDASDSQFTSYFDDAGVGSFRNITSVFEETSFTDDSTITIDYRVEDKDALCRTFFGTYPIHYEMNIFVYDIDNSKWVKLGGDITLNVTNYGTYSVAPNLNFSLVTVGLKISGGSVGCGYGTLQGSKGNIGIDSVKAVNIQNTDVDVGSCRDMEWFETTFTNSSSASGHWGMSRMFNNSQFMDTFGDYDVNDKLNLDNTVFTKGYCYSEVLIDNIESTSESTFTNGGLISDIEDDDYIEYDWLSRLGWRPRGDAKLYNEQYGGIGYMSNYYDFSVCKAEGRNLNAGQFCIAVVHFEVGLDLIKTWIYGNFIYFMIILILIMGFGMIVDMYRK